MDADDEDVPDELEDVPVAAELDVAEDAAAEEAAGAADDDAAGAAGTADEEPDEEPDDPVFLETESVLRETFV
jgi:hypothetical protein